MWSIAKNKELLFKNIFSDEQCKKELIYVAENMMNKQNCEIRFKGLFLTDDTNTYAAYWIEPNGAKAKSNAIAMCDSMSKKYNIKMCVTKGVYYVVYPCEYISKYDSNNLKKVIYEHNSGQNEGCKGGIR